MNGVRVISLQFQGQNIPLIMDKKGDLNNNHFTVIIGKNASGKSRILASILNKIRIAKNHRLKPLEDSGYLRLWLNNEEYMISGKSYNPDDFKEINLLSISNSLFDKFPFSTKSDKNYTYIGQRMIGLSTHRRAIINDVLDVLNDNINTKEYQTKALKLFNFIGIEPFIRIKLRLGTNYKSIEKNDKHFIDPSSDLRKFLLELSQQRFFQNQSYFLEKKANDNDFINGLKEYIQKNLLFFARSNYTETIDYTIDFNSTTKSDHFTQDYEYFSILRRLNLLSYYSITVRKGNQEFDILESSTGQIGLLTTLLRALPHLKDNSIILIDEPEISLHPTWQMQYIELLQNYLSGFSGCHILIATHSHFLLSDLNPDWSSVVTIEAQKDGLNGEVLEYTPYSWSPEAILYNVFGIKGLRNHYFEYDVRTLLELISNNSKNKTKIKNLIEKLEEFKLPQGDPMKTILDEANYYLDSISK
ncbi:putative ATP-binding protein involved in virulence [Algoriphagus boseongensis]|uniref:Putative ATP-binding protein involved in virulence n=2 Tax=Algoriphagus boseongensis TaxID=1442587 RepID=A0A4R6T8V7_9BACT|nr:putative ATP-binding protein involved in virulence [Algoriphagus boseongensis]